MATLVLSSIGNAVAGPLGGLIGAFAGGAIDRSLLGGAARLGPRLTDLAVQSSAYGEALPRLYGIIRVAGAIIWSTGLREDPGGAGSKSGGGTRFAYSTSVAIALSARPIREVRRIWADGRLIRDAAGVFSVATGFRLHGGGEGQEADPLIASAEGATGTPAYRGLAYVVFEDLQLAEFGNRIPQFSFEVVADEPSVGVGEIVADVFAAADVPIADASALAVEIAGYGIGRAATLSSILAQIDLLERHDLRVEGRRLSLVRATQAVATAIDADEIGAAAEGRRVAAANWSRPAIDRLSGEVSVGYLDPARDYQAGLQRARRDGATGARELHELPAVLSAAEAKRLAETLGLRFAVRSAGRKVAVPFRHCGLEVGDWLTLPDDARPWRVTAMVLDAMTVVLDLVARTAAGPGTPGASDGGRVAPNPLLAQGATELRILDVPAFDTAPIDRPRLLLAANGTTAAWRRCELLVSVDDGAEYRSIGITPAPSTLGVSRTILAAGPCDRWDELGWVEVELSRPDLWLEGRGAASVLAGANLAALGDELIHFRDASALGGGRFRLAGLLRGRYGSEAAVAAHAIGEAFTLIDPAATIAFEVPAHALGAVLLFKAIGPLDTIATARTWSARLRGVNLRSIAPANLGARRLADGAIELAWTRRSRAGFAWIDGGDAPLAEEAERYAVTLAAPGGATSTIETTRELAVVSAADQSAWFGGPLVDFRAVVAQISATVGPGTPASANFVLPG